MRIFAHTKFEGFYPVGVAAVVAAESRDEAADILNTQLRERGLPGDAREKDMVEIPNDAKGVWLLCDGDY